MAEYVVPPPHVTGLHASPPRTGSKERAVATGGDAEDDERVIGPDFEESRYRLLVPLLAGSTDDDTERLMQTAAALVHDREGDLLVQCLVTVPKQTPSELLTEDESFVREQYEIAEQLLETATAHGLSANAVVSVAGAEARAVLDIADRYDCDGVLVAVGGERSQRRRLLTGATVEKIATHAECDVFVEKRPEEMTPIESVLLAVSGGPHSGLAAETARALARASGAHVDAVHLIGKEPTESEQDDADEILQAAAGVLNDVEHAETDLQQTNAVAETIVQRSADYDVTVLGAPTAGLLKQFVFGTVPDSVTRRTENAVLMAKRNTDAASVYERWVTGYRADVPEEAYECMSCGETFEERRQVCPECGGYDIQREWSEDL